MMFPLLTSDDIRTLKGEPMGKRFELIRNSPLEEIEEWIYYNMCDKSKECYLFRNGKLIKYKHS